MQKGVRSIALAPDKEVLAISMAFKAVLYSLRDTSLVREMPVKVKGVDSFAFSMDGQWFIIGTADKKIRIYKTR